jgi:hypothetical protein
MDGDGADHFEAFVDALAEVVGHADQVRPLRDYCMRACGEGNSAAAGNTVRLTEAQIEGLAGRLL